MGVEVMWLAFFIEDESCCRCDTGKDVEKDTSCLCHAFSKPSWSSMFEVQLSLADLFGRNDAASKVLLDRFSRTQF